ncbi:hypothetical protein J437_LFUL012266 [Ladona fulva]|uniref:Uncharacterized protein n=1 Tax=Ladona fulva TaxID=123851 RepID=A0A8K0K7V2_LADFU|nr:hypothetical protein J437_LFUL012266 [Ladona fulva]
MGAPCYMCYCGPRHNKESRWIPAVIVKVLCTRSVKVRVFPRGPIWHRHIDHLRPCFGADQDDDSGEIFNADLVANATDIPSAPPSHLISGKFNREDQCRR